MFTEPFEALAAPRSAGDFARAMSEICTQAGAERFLFIRLRRASSRSVVDVVHNGDAQVEERLSVPDDKAVTKLVELFTGPFARAPVVLGPQTGLVLDLPGFAYGMSVFASAEWGGCIVVFARAEVPLQMDELLALSSSAQLAAQMALTSSPGSIEGPLSQRELDCLRYFMAGRDSRQTAQALKISARTVEGHLARVRLRCAAESTLAASMTALREGWVLPSEIRAIERAA